MSALLRCRARRGRVACGLLLLTVLALSNVSGASAAAGPTLTVTENCPIYEGQQLYGVLATLSGLPPNTEFLASINLGGLGEAGPVALTTDANGNYGPSGLGIAAPIDFVTVTITYADVTLSKTLMRPCQTTNTTVVCTTGSVMMGQATTCTATVSDAPTSAQGTPGGTVSFTTSGAGSFAGSPCTLSGSGASASCSVSYTPATLGSGSHTLTATYGGDGLHSTSSGITTVTVKPGLPTSTAQCKHGGWRNYPQFKNQGDCVSFVNHGKRRDRRLGRDSGFRAVPARR